MTTHEISRNARPKGGVTNVTAARATGLRPYSVASIEPFRLSTALERQQAAERAGLNVSLLDPVDVDVDLRTDSATAARITSQLAATAAGKLSPDDPLGHEAAVREISSLTGKRHVVLFAQGRAAEAALTDALPLEGSVVASNGLFPSTRFHIERRGARVLEFPIADAGTREGDPGSYLSDLDMESARSAISRSKARAAIWIELAANGTFGQPVSLACLERAADAARSLDAGLYLDATRCLENAVLVRRRDSTARDLSIRDIVRLSMRGAHAVSASCLKSFHCEAGGFVATDDDELFSALEDAAIARGDGLSGASREVLRLGIAFSSLDDVAEDRAGQVARLHRLLHDASLPVFSPEAAHAVFLDAGRFLPHVPQEERPGKALALALYLRSGIRVDEHFLPGSLANCGMSVVRIAVPARRYFDDQLEWVAREIQALHEFRSEVPALEQIEHLPGLARSLRARFRIATRVMP